MFFVSCFLLGTVDNGHEQDRACEAIPVEKNRVYIIII